MRFYTRQHRYYCGIDLHARSIYLCIMDQAGEILLHRSMRANPNSFLKAVAPYREDLVVSVECMFTWYWLADLCRSEKIAFVLGHALYMKAIHGGKAKNDRIDALKIATLLRGGMIPRAYVYPPEMQYVMVQTVKEVCCVLEKLECVTSICQCGSRRRFGVCG
jgi:transposase